MTEPKVNGKFRQPKNPNFSRIMEAREALQRKAEKWANDYANLIEQAVKKGDIEFGTKAIQWAFEHMQDEEGQRVVAGSVDKIKEQPAIAQGPQINIGFALGGLPQTRALEGASIVDSQYPVRLLHQVETVGDGPGSVREGEEVPEQGRGASEAEGRGSSQRDQESVPADQRVAGMDDQTSHVEVSTRNVPSSGEGVTQEVGTRCQNSISSTDGSATTQPESPLRSASPRAKKKSSTTPTQSS